MDRAQIGGLDDVGIGALFGLADYRCAQHIYVVYLSCVTVLSLSNNRYTHACTASR